MALQRTTSSKTELRRSTTDRTLISPHSVFFWKEMVDPLRCIGHPDLAVSLERLLRAYWDNKRPLSRWQFSALHAALGSLDNRFLGGRIR